jgi:hypothetical protein
VFTRRCPSIKPASNCRNWGIVNAGVRIFPPPRLPIQEPRGQQRQGLMVVPASPGPHLIVGQPRLALGPSEAFLDPMSRPGHPGQLLQRLLGIGVGQVVVMLELAVGLGLTRAEEQLLRPGAAGLGPGLHPTLGDATSTTSGPFSPSRTSIRVQTDSGKAARQRSRRRNRLMGYRPRPE